MEKKDFFEENIKNLIFSHGEELKMDEEQKKKIIERLITKSTDGQIKEKSHFYKFRKLAIAAAVVLVPALIAIYLFMFSSQKIEIPPELASMSIEQLLKLNYDTSQNTYDPNIVRYALKQALDKSTPEEVIKIAKDLNTGGLKIQAQRVAPPVHPVSDSIGYARKTFQEVVEESNLFVHARLIGCNLNVEDIIAALVEKEKFSGLEDYMSKYKVTIQLYVIDSLPNNMLKKGKTITIPTVLYEDQLNAIKKNSDYYFAMAQEGNNEPHFLEFFSGVYPVDFNKPANVELWQFFKDAQDVLLFGQDPKPETISYWVSKLKGDTFALALEYMNVLPDELLPSDSIMNAIEQSYRDFISLAKSSDEEKSKTDDRNKRIELENKVYNLRHDNIPLFEKVMALLVRSGNRDEIRRMLSLIDEDIEYGNRGIIMGQYGFNSRQFVPLFVRMIIASQENIFDGRLIETYIKYRDRLFAVTNYGNAVSPRPMQPSFAHDLTIELINQVLKLPVKQARSMLLRILDESNEIGLSDASDFKKIWAFLGSDEDYNMRSYLEKFLSDPNLSNIGVQQIRNGVILGLSVFSFEQAAFEVLNTLPESVRPNHEELINFLLMIYKRNKGDQSCVNFTVNTFGDMLEPSDVECLPILSELLLMDKPHWAIPNIIAQRMPDQSLVPAIRLAIRNKKFDGSGEASLVEALYACGQKDEAITKVLEIFAEPLREDNARNLLEDLRLRSNLILFLGKTENVVLVPVIEKYTTKEFEKYRDFSNDLTGRVIGYTLNDLMQNAIMALARLDGKSSIPGLREIYKTTDDIRVRIVCALALYYNGDKTGEKLLRYFVEGTHRNLPEVETRWFVDLNGGTAFQSVIKAYLRNKLTDALWLEKLQYYVDRADTDTESDFFKDHRKEILNIMVEHLNHKSRTVRGYASEILQKATGQNFGFEADRYAGQQDDIIQRWREYLNKFEL